MGCGRSNVYWYHHRLHDMSSTDHIMLVYDICMMNFQRLRDSEQEIMNDLLRLVLDLRIRSSNLK
jgi:hypothetical protein